MNQIKYPEIFDSIVFINNRIFAQRNHETGDMDWYFESREGDFGPYDSEDAANANLLRHIDRCQCRNLDGGRKFELTRTCKLRGFDKHDDHDVMQRATP